MLSKWMVPVLGLACCAMVGVASAAEPAHAAQSTKPTVLSLAQMDNVTAGHGLVNISDNNVQVASISQVGVVMGGGSVSQGALAINYFSAMPR